MCQRLFSKHFEEIILKNQDLIAQIPHLNLEMLWSAALFSNWIWYYVVPFYSLILYDPTLCSASEYFSPIGRLAPFVALVTLRYIALVFISLNYMIFMLMHTYVCVLHLLCSYWYSSWRNLSLSYYHHQIGSINHYITAMQSMVCANNCTLWLEARIPLFAHYSISLSSVFRCVWKHWTYKMLVMYVLSIVSKIKFISLISCYAMYGSVWFQLIHWSFVLGVLHLTITAFEI